MTLTFSSNSSCTVNLVRYLPFTTWRQRPLLRPQPPQFFSPLRAASQRTPLPRLITFTSCPVFFIKVQHSHKRLKLSILWRGLFVEANSSTANSDVAVLQIGQSQTLFKLASQTTSSAKVLQKAQLFQPQKEDKITHSPSTQFSSVLRTSELIFPVNRLHVTLHT